MNITVSLCRIARVKQLQLEYTHTHTPSDFLYSRLSMQYAHYNDACNVYNYILVKLQYFLLCLMQYVLDTSVCAQYVTLVGIST